MGKKIELLWPVWDTEAPVMQGWNENQAIYRRYSQLGHNGIDIGVVEGTGVLASLDAKVLYAGEGVDFSYMGAAAGLCVVLETKDLLVGYAHLSHIYVEKGDSVASGDVIALSGATGAVSGPHLHWEALRKPLSLDNGYMGRFDITPHVVRNKAPLPKADIGPPLLAITPPESETLPTTKAVKP